MHKTSLGISLSVMSSSTASRFMRRIGMALLGLIVVLLALAVLGAIYQAIATELAERAYPPPGEMVDVGGYSLHINCVGQGSPTVILDAGWGDLVGHSLGGISMQTYAHRYPEEVAGVVLVDSSTDPDPFSQRPEARDSDEPQRQRSAVVSQLERFGISLPARLGI